MMAMAGVRTPADVESVLEAVKAEVRKTIVGYEEQVEDFMMCLITQGHILMEGVPGVAKTTLSKAFASICGLSYRRMQFTQDLLPADITGHYFFNQKTGEFELRRGPLFADLVLADEINRAPPKTQSALLEAMQERQVTIEGNTFELPDPFMVIATLNPIETEGVYPLPEAQLDRFMYKSVMDYVSEDEELRIIDLKSRKNETPGRVLERETVLGMRRLFENMTVDDSVKRYIRDIVIATRDKEALTLGASPRAGEHMLYAAKAHALLAGQDYVIPDDVKAIAHKVLDHRLILSIDSELEGVTVPSVVDDILGKVPVPRTKGEQAEGA
jgi:MoxR-like ATPase